MTDSLGNRASLRASGPQEILSVSKTESGRTWGENRR